MPTGRSIRASASLGEFHQAISDGVVDAARIHSPGVEREQVNFEKLDQLLNKIVRHGVCSPVQIVPGNVAVLRAASRYRSQVLIGERHTRRG